MRTAEHLDDVTATTWRKACALEPGMLTEFGLVASVAPFDLHVLRIRFIGGGARFTHPDERIELA